MNCIIPFTKDIKFNGNIGEILSVSLEHEFTANNNEILGNFIVSGDYKTHEVSINKEHFEHVLPFSVDMTTRIDSDSVDFSVEDFTYEIIDNDTLRVNIEYSVNAAELPEEELFEPTEEEPLEEFLDKLESENDDASVREEIPENDKEEVKEEEMIKEDVRDEEVEMTEDIKKTEETVINSISDADDVYVTYHIHIFKETDTIESICAKYNTSQSLLGEYNDLNTLAIGDKVIIPEYDE